MSEPIDYDTLTADFEQSLVTTLRGHRPAEDYLETWVPDEDPVKGILNMIESAQAAHRDNIAIRVRSKTLAPGRYDELKRLAEKLGVVSIESTVDGALVRVSKIASGSDFEGIHPCFRVGLRSAFGHLAHEGEVKVGEGLTKAEAVIPPVSLTTLVDPRGHLIREAKHRGGRSDVERAALDSLCALLPGMTVQEAADHGVLRLVDSLRDKAQPAPVRGIVMPHNADPVFGMPNLLVRKLREGYAANAGEKSTENFFDTPPSARWQGLSSAQKESAIRGILQQFATEQGLHGEDLTLVALEPDLLKHDVRVFVVFSEHVEPGKKPALMRKLERKLKEQVEGKLQLYMQELKDKNVIRRL